MSVRFKASTYIPTTLKVVVTGTQRALTGFLIVSMSAIWTNVPAMAATPVPSTGVSLNYPAPILKFCTPIARPVASIGSLPGYVQFQIAVDDPVGRPIIRLKQSDFAFPATRNPPLVVFFHEYEVGPPVSIIMLIDVSGSMERKLPKVQSALAAFLYD
jgi:hypothetical protein